MIKENAKHIIEQLVSKYKKIIEDNRVKKYNEEMTKKDFILPLFRALGWNVEDSREVTAEEKISKGRVDYGFRIDGISKFFLEAKSLKADLDNEKYFEQAISYAWHKGCTWAILTDFEAVKILNAEWKAANYLQSHFATISCNEYIERFDELWLLSKESFEKGWLNKKAEKWGKKTKKSSIDEQLLEDFTRYRSILTKSVSKLNQKLNLTENDLDESVQRILDRLIFIRNCEDRELEQKLLISKLREWKSKGRGKLVRSLRDVFDYFDDQYNSKIFSEHLCDSLEIENEVISEIISGLYYTKEKYFAISYDFSVIGADVLGNIYEQYLNHILKKTAKRAKVTKNGRHRKEQGIYYTPTYLVDYIIRNTLGKLLENKKIDVENIRVLDPACGSGSFLIKAFDIFDEYYKKNSKDYSQTQLDNQEVGIPFTKRAKILQENIFGVDLDKQAVEIAQLNLLLKIAEKGHRLPLLEKNIKRGNSLIDDESVDKKAFNWANEYSEILQQGGFDIIIGNPPYYNIKSTSSLRDLNDYKLLSNGVVNISALFVKRAMDLLNENGFLGFIIPKSFAYVESWKPLREYLFNNSQLVKVVDVSKAFKDVLLEQLIIIVKKQKPKPRELVEIVSDLNQSSPTSDHITYGKLVKNNTIDFSMDSFERKIHDKINQNSIMLSEISENFRGIGAQKYAIKNLVSSSSERILSGKEIQRYLVSDYHNYFVEKEHNLLFKKAERLRQPRIMCQNIVAHIGNHIKITATFDDKGTLNFDTVNNIIITSNKFLHKYILALLNSKLISYYTYNFIYSKAIRTMHFDRSYSGKIPIKDISIETQKVFEKIVDELISLNSRQKVMGFKKTDDGNKMKYEAEKLMHDLDEKIFALYGLDSKEVQSVNKTYV